MQSLTIQHHAVLFALLSRQAITRCGESGKAAILKAMTRYGNERGRRMAQNALDRGDQLTLLNSQAYGEWQPEYAGQVESGIISGQPTLTTYISRCPWCDAWAQHGLTEYGKYYCVNIDNAWFQGFNSDFLCTPVTAAMSWGGERCEFDWGAPLSEDEIKQLAVKKQQLGSSCVRDFSFHTAHILHTVSNVLIEELGPEGEAAVASAKAEFDNLFGPECLESIDGIYP